MYSRAKSRQERQKEMKRDWQQHIQKNKTRRRLGAVWGLKSHTFFTHTTAPSTTTRTIKKVRSNSNNSNNEKRPLQRRGGGDKKERKKKKTPTKPTPRPSLL
jgi:hypothetical protein